MFFRTLLLLLVGSKEIHIRWLRELPLFVLAVLCSGVLMVIKQASFPSSLGEGNALQVEFMGVIMAFEVAIDKNLDNIWIELDSITVVRALHNTNLVHWFIKSRWLNCLHNLRNLGLLITHIFWEGNTCADNLSSLGLKNIYMLFVIIMQLEKLEKIY